jgi:hypothetical protein
MTPARTRLLTALLPLLACCGAVADDAQDPGIEGTLVLARADLHAVIGATTAGDIIVITSDGSVLALDTSASFAPTVIGTFEGHLRHELHIEVAGGAVLVWRDRGGGEGWQLDAWNRTRGLHQVASSLRPPTPYGVTTATPDGQRIIFATGGDFVDGVGHELVYQGVTLAAGDPRPVHLARMPAGSDYLVRVAVAGERAVLTRYSERALAADHSKLGWPESQEPWEVQWFDEAWQPLRIVPHTEGIAIDDAALRVATNDADGELAIESLDGSPSIAVDAGCRFANAFFLPGGGDVLYTCRGAAYRFHVATRARTALGDGITGAYPLRCGDAVCRDWVGGSGSSIVAVGGGAPLAGPVTGSVATVHGDIHGELSPDGRFAIAPADGGAKSIVLDQGTRGFTWVDGARFVFTSASESNAYYEDAASTVSWRDPSMTGARGERVVTRSVYSPFARAEEHALYAIARGADHANGLYRFPLPD